MRNKLFYGKKHLTVHSKIVDFLNKQNEDTLDIKRTVREIGDRVGKLLAENFEEFIGDFGSNYIVDSAYKKMANVKFSDDEGFTYYIDVITHNLSAKFSRPNITSVDRLTNLYKDDKNVFVVLMVDYDPRKKKDWFSNIVFLPIEFINWQSLTFGLLGKGQIQIKKSSDIIEMPKFNRKEWMIKYAKELNRFYVKAADKIVGQLKLAISIDDEWSEKEDTWK
ncbi:MAG: hypothetical protein GY936_10025 [Ignavibacteriae bacterium]|nr:hypothetical protein [Ignavibacteriota bacterium]